MVTKASRLVLRMYVVETFIYAQESAVDSITLMNLMTMMTMMYTAPGYACRDRRNGDVQK